MIDPKNGKSYPFNPKRTWSITIDTFEKYYSEGKIVFPGDYDFLRIGIPAFRVFESEDKRKSAEKYGTDSPMKAVSTLLPKEVGMSESGNGDMMDLLGGKIFSFPKPVSLIKYVLGVVNDDSAIILDFFAGSGTTAQAVMELNLEDGGNRQCICVQMPEILDKDSEAYKAGYRTIADITRARIDKVIAKLKKEQPEKMADLACAQFSLAPSNFNTWRGDGLDAQALREQMEMFQQAEKQGKADAQTTILAELLLKLGQGALGVHAISKPKTIAGVTIHRVLMADNRHLWLCFDAYNATLKDEIVKAKPAQVVFLNSCFVGPKADEQLSNLQLELDGLNINLQVI